MLNFEKKLDEELYLDQTEVEEIIQPKINRKYKNQRKFLIKDKRSNFERMSNDKTILDDDVFYGKQVAKKHPYAIKTFCKNVYIGIPVKKYDSWDRIFNETRKDKFNHQLKIVQLKEGFIDYENQKVDDEKDEARYWIDDDDDSYFISTIDDKYSNLIKYNVEYDKYWEEKHESFDCIVDKANREQSIYDDYYFQDDCCEHTEDYLYQDDYYYETSFKI